MFRPIPVRGAVMAVLALLLVLPGTAGAAAWLAPVHFGGTTGSAPSPAVDASGNAIVGWQAGSPSIIQAARHAIGTPGFSALPNVSPTTGFDATSPVVVLNRSGTGLAAWVQTRSLMANDMEIDILPLLANGTTGGLTKIGSAGTSPSNITAAINARGDAVVAWQEGAARVAGVTRQGVSGAFTDATTPDVLDPVGTNPVAAIDDAGNAIVVMEYNTGVVQGISAARHPPGGAWQRETLSDSSHPYTDPAVGSNPSGTMVVAFKKDGGIVSAVTGTVAAGWGATPTVKPLSTSSDTVNHGPLASVAASGAATVGWATASAIQTSSRPAGGSFPGPGAVSSIPVGTPDDFGLGGNARGDVVISWSTFDTQFMQNVVRAAVRPAGAPSFGAPKVVSNTRAYGSKPLIALDEQGDAVLAYPEGPTQTGGVDITVFDASAPQMTVAGPSTVLVKTGASFRGSVTDAFSPFATKWSFGDGGSATGASVSHTFTRTGRFTVTLTATDTAGNATSKSLTVTVTALPLPRCVVPKLKGKTLSQAKTALSKAHCRLGKVHQPKVRKHHKPPKLVVASSSPRAGTSRPNGTKVGLTLGPAPNPKPKPKKH
jgi:hypothetical protein